MKSASSSKRVLTLLCVAIASACILRGTAAKAVFHSGLENDLPDWHDEVGGFEPSLFGEIRVDTNTGEFKDAYNRVIIFHGSNLVEKDFPWYPSELLNETYLNNLQKWGFNAFRLGTMWSGFMPENGDEFNETYIGIIHQIVDNLNKRGIYPLFDMHQDVLTSLYNSYDGVPRWLVSQFPPPKHAYPWPLSKSPSGANWAEGYLTEAVSSAFGHLYRNTSGSITYWARFWQRVAKEFASNRNTLGYELINEPWAGDFFQDPAVMVPGIAGSLNLMPVYNVLADAIRQVDDRSLIFYEPVTWGVYSSSMEAGTGFFTVPGGPDYEDRSVLSYHYYCWLLTDADEKGPYPVFKKVVCDDLLLKKAFPSVLSSVKRTGGGLFLTEFGNCAPNNHTDWTDTIECEAVISTADSYKQSWTYWDATFYDGEGHVLVDSVRHFARVYPRATAGILHSYSFQPYTSIFTMSYAHDPSITQPTIVFVPELHYPNQQFSVDLQPSESLNWKYDPDYSVIYITSVPGYSNDLEDSLIEATLTIRPK